MHGSNSTIIWKYLKSIMMILQSTFLNMMISLLNYDDKSTCTGAKLNTPIMIGLIDTFFGLHIPVILTFKSTDLI